jgi:hypothetical protein
MASVKPFNVTLVVAEMKAVSPALHPGIQSAHGKTIAAAIS